MRNLPKRHYQGSKVQRFKGVQLCAKVLNAFTFELFKHFNFLYALLFVPLKFIGGNGGVSESLITPFICSYF